VCQQGTFSKTNFRVLRSIKHNTLPLHSFYKTMATTLNLFCVVSGELTSNAFKVKIENNADVTDLKEAIKAKNPATFEHVDAKDLTLWRVSIPPSDDDELPIVLDTLNSDKTKLTPRTRLSTLFPEGLDDNTYIIVERPKGGQGMSISLSYWTDGY